MKSYRIRIETNEKEEIQEVTQLLEKGFEIVSNPRTYQKRNNSGYMHYLTIRIKETAKPTESALESEVN